MARQHDNLPYGKIISTADVGDQVRAHRKAQNATQAEFASLCGVGMRFISDLENGKPTMELGKVLHVLQCLGLELVIQPRDWKKSAPVTPTTNSTVDAEATVK
jgi:y4mF family transcriptional regulator